MTTFNFGTAGTITNTTRMIRICAAMLLALAAGQVMAQDNAIESITANQAGGKVILNIGMKNPVAKPPIGFSITNPSRIALDFGATTNGTGKSMQDINLGDVRSANVVQAGPRTRVVLNLKRALNYATVVDGKTVVVTIEGSGAPVQGVNASGVVVPPADAPVASAGPQLLRDLDFKRGANGEGRVVVDLPHSQVGVDVRQVGNQVLVDFVGTGLPPTLRRRLDVTDFGTPVERITTAPQGANVRMTIDARGSWEQSVYQSDTQLVIDVKPVKEDPNRLPGNQGGQGYRGEKLSFNFQNVEVRAALQAIADISGLNIITSDSVGGNLTLRLKDVPWDQALDVVLQAKGLDMRKNGSVLWIAPKEEMLTKEKLELEQKSQIAELEPLKSEIFQLNYQKAEAFRTVFGLDAGGGGAAAGTGAPAGGSSSRVLSKRGSAVIDARTNQLFVTDIQSKLDDIRRLIQKTDVASKQVLIEARLVEANDGFSRNLGAKLGVSDLRTQRGGDSGYEVSGNTRVAVSGNLNGVATTTGQPVDASDTAASNTLVNLPAAAINGVSAPSIAFSLFSSAANRFLNLELSALEADGKGKIISSPRVLTEDKMAAIIEQGIELPYSSSTVGVGTVTPTVTFKKANLKLEVTPQITPDGNVVLDVEVNKDSKGDLTSAGYAINTQHVKTRVMVENGGTVVLGGIYQQNDQSTDTKVPLLGDVPVLGYLFKTTSRSTTKTELLVFITPKIVADKANASR